MARSRYIYVVCWDAPQNMDAPHIIAAFTVKHEMQTWLSRCTHEHRDEFAIYRVRDNDRATLRRSDVEDIT